ncbi:hypothetical protein CEXT_56281 [Caerostris extrusa]|uniref:Uncharacterized protein n=1 Tax=Caerostris extrusa TaxID=172846 RepID=A0AAV4PPC6_CAEEX|nr:hypothetical protein CEXT_56281 [Caerostris extrusa]
MQYDWQRKSLKIGISFCHLPLTIDELKVICIAVAVSKSSTKQPTPLLNFLKVVEIYSNTTHLDMKAAIEAEDMFFSVYVVKDSIMIVQLDNYHVNISNVLEIMQQKTAT